MPSKESSKSKSKSKSRTKSASSRSAAQSNSSASAAAAAATPPALPSAGFLLTCDPPTKQFIRHLNETKSVDQKFIIEDLDATHLLVEGKAKGEILRKVEEWLDENVFSNSASVGENLETWHLGKGCALLLISRERLFTKPRTGGFSLI